MAGPLDATDISIHMRHVNVAFNEIRPSVHEKVRLEKMKHRERLFFWLYNRMTSYDDVSEIHLLLIFCRILGIMKS